MLVYNSGVSISKRCNKIIMMKISIIIPVYNGEKYLESCLDKIINQNVDKEVLLVEDGSTDNSYRICEEFCRKYDFIKLYRNPSKGTSAGRNFALSKVTGDIVTFCDQDDYIEPDALNKVIGVFNNRDIKVLISAFYSVTDIHKKYRGLGIDKSMTCYEVIPQVINDLRITGCCWSKFYKKEAIEGVFFDEDLSYAEDITFVCRVLMKNKDEKCMIIKDCCYTYYDGNPENLSNNKDKLFDDNGNLKYNNCFNRIRTFINDDRKINYEIGYIIETYSINTLRSVSVTGIRKSKLIREIENNFWSLILLFFKYGILNNTKKIICAMGYVLEYNIRGKKESTYV